MYVGILGRDAEYAGWLFQRDALQGLPQITLVSNFLNSAEFHLKFGYPSDPEFVRIMYRNILLREPGQAEVDFQASALQSGTSREQLALNFLLSQEFAIGTGPRLTAFILHATILMRDPNQAEFNEVANGLSSGKSVLDLFDGKVNGQEHKFWIVNP